MRFHAAVIMLKRAQKIQQTLIMHSSKYAASKLNNRVLNYFRIITSHAALHSLILAELLNASYFSQKNTFVSTYITCTYTPTHQHQSVLEGNTLLSFSKQFSLLLILLAVDKYIYIVPANLERQ